MDLCVLDRGLLVLMHYCVPRLLPTVIVLLDTVSGPWRGQMYLQPVPFLRRQCGGQRGHGWYNPNGSHPSGLETSDANGTEDPGIRYLLIGGIVNCPVPGERMG